MPSFFCMPLFACNRQVDSLDKRQCNLQAIPSDIERYARTLEELLLDMNHIKELPKVCPYTYADANPMSSVFVPVAQAAKAGPQRQ